MWETSQHHIGVREPRRLQHGEGRPLAKQPTPEQELVQQRIERVRTEAQRVQKWLDTARRHEVRLRTAVRPMRPAEAFREVGHGEPAVAHESQHKAASPRLATPTAPASPNYADHPRGEWRAASKGRRREVEIPSPSRGYSESQRWFRAPSPKLGMPVAIWRDKPTPGPGQYAIPSSFS